jgi:hypothetical protein
VADDPGVAPCSFSPVAQYDPETKLVTTVGSISLENCSGACLVRPGTIAMGKADKSGVTEPEESVIREGKTADTEESGIRGWYRGDLNGAYQEWREGGKPQDATQPVTKKLLSEARLYADRMFSKHIKSYHVLWYDESRVRIEEANERSIQRAMALHDHSREGGASFTTYVRKAVFNIKSLLRVKNIFCGYQESCGNLRTFYCEGASERESSVIARVSLRPFTCMSDRGSPTDVSALCP